MPPQPARKQQAKYGPVALSLQPPIIRRPPTGMTLLGSQLVPRAHPFHAGAVLHSMDKATVCGVLVNRRDEMFRVGPVRTLTAVKLRSIFRQPPRLQGSSSSRQMWHFAPLPAESERHGHVNTILPKPLQPIEVLEITPSFAYGWGAGAASLSDCLRRFW